VTIQNELNYMHVSHHTLVPVAMGLVWEPLTQQLTWGV